MTASRQWANRWSRAQGTGSWFAHLSCCSGAHLPRSPTGLADGFGAKECAVRFRFDEDEDRIHPRMVGPPLPDRLLGFSGIRPEYSVVCASLLSCPCNCQMRATSACRVLTECEPRTYRGAFTHHAHSRVGPFSLSGRQGERNTPFRACNPLPGAPCANR